MRRCHEASVKRVRPLGLPGTDPVFPPVDAKTILPWWSRDKLRLYPSLMRYRGGRCTTAVVFSQIDYLSRNHGVRTMACTDCAVRDMFLSCM